MYPEAVLQQPSETENTRFLTMCKSIATKNAKLKLTLTDNVIEANYANISNELVTTDYIEGDYRIRWIGIVADRVPNKKYGGTYIHEDMPTCIKGVLEVEYTDEEATKECVYDKIQGESYTFKIGDFNHEESSAFDYYFNGAILIPFSNAQIQASFTYRPVSGTEKSVQVKSLVNNGQMLPYFDISELFGQAANTVMAVITSNTAVENVDMGGRPVTTIALTSNVQNFTDANDEIMVGSILTLMPSSLPQTNVENTFTATQTFGHIKTSGVFGTGDKLLLSEYANAAALGVVGTIRPRVAQVTEGGTTYKELALLDDTKQAGFIEQGGSLIYLPGVYTTPSGVKLQRVIGNTQVVFSESQTSTTVDLTSIGFYTYGHAFAWICGATVYTWAKFTETNTILISRATAKSEVVNVVYMAWKEVTA